uniref:ATP synthase complex subunit 8 n=1 Tax=Tropidomantis tenera TaxID=627780 RepID=A0A343UMY5_9NEOP|nr:ATP synthase F0 subunit 8 [Tropidomantis tenera]AVE15635.1 ATP synthase F0 subunit 8 [Tropidomantis tenera]
MPQMMPLNWLMLFTFFSLMLLLFNVMNYYTPFKLPLTKSFTKTMMKKSFSWKW